MPRRDHRVWKDTLRAAYGSLLRARLPPGRIPRCCSSRSSQEGRPGERVHVSHDGAGLLLQLFLQQLSAVGMWVGVCLIPLHSGSHLHNVAHAHAVVGAPLELRQVTSEGIIQAGDQALLEGRAHQGRGDGLGHGKGDPAGIRSSAEFVVLESHLAVLEHEQAGDAIVGQIIKQIIWLASRMEMDVLERRRCGRERPHGAPPRGTRLTGKRVSLCSKVTTSTPGSMVPSNTWRAPVGCCATAEVTQQRSSRPMTRTGGCVCMARVYGQGPLWARAKDGRPLIRRASHISRGNAPDKIGEQSREQGSGMGVATKLDSLRSRLNYEPQELGFGTSGRRGKVVDLTQLEVYLNALAELEYLQSLAPAEGGIKRGDPFYFAYDLRPSSSEFVSQEQGRGELAQAIVAAIGDAGMQAVNLGRIPTPALASFALSRKKGSIMVTGSHIPFERNGYKTNSSRGELLKQQEAPINEQVRQVRKRLYEQPWDQSRFDERGMLKGGHQPLPLENR
jgi:hypothetical protein